MRIKWKITEMRRNMEELFIFQCFMINECTNVYNIRIS
jgi:hypothetical protein